MPNSWFRLYAEIRRDPKVQTMPETFQLRLIWLFTLRCEGPTEKLSLDELTYGLGCNGDVTLDKLHEAFLSKGFIEEDWSVVNWDKRQYVSDSSTDRVKKFREKQALKQSETFLKQPETQNETHQNRTEQNIPEQKQKKTRPQKVLVAECPLEWIDHQAWMEFWAMRESNRWKTTDGAVRGIINKLQGFHDKGLDCNEILGEAIIRNWRGLFEIKENGGSNGHYETKPEREQREFNEALKRMEALDAQEAQVFQASFHRNV